MRESIELTLKEEEESDNINSLELNEEISNHSENDWEEDKKEMILIGGIALGCLLLFALIASLLYFSFRKPVEKIIHKYINQIPVSTQNDKDSNKENTENTIENTNKEENSSKNCTKPFDGIYVLGNEEINLVSDSSYNRYLGEEIIDFGKYNIQKGTISVSITTNNQQIELTYRISKDCKQITENGTEKTYTRK